MSRLPGLLGGDDRYGVGMYSTDGQRPRGWGTPDHFVDLFHGFAGDGGKDEGLVCNVL
jgi:hypothetical protein